MFSTWDIGFWIDLTQHRRSPMSTECGGNLSKPKTSLWLGALATMLAALVVIPAARVHGAA